MNGHTFYTHEYYKRYVLKEEKEDEKNGVDAEIPVIFVQFNVVSVTRRNLKQ